MLEYERKSRLKLKTLYDGNLKNIFKAYASDSTGSWYKFANDQKVLDIVVPTQSDIVARTLNTIVELMYSDATITKNEDNITIDTLKYLEKVVQLNGECIVMVDYDSIARQRVLSIMSPDEYDKTIDNIGNLYTFHTYFDFEDNDTEYRLENIRYANRNVMEYLVYEAQDFNKSPEERNYLDLSAFSHLFNLAPVYEAQGHKFAYHFSTDYKFKKILPMVEVLDEALTYTRLATRLSIPTSYIPEDIAQMTFDGNEKQPVDFLYDRLCGFTKIVTIDADKQKVDVDNPGLKSEDYKAVFAMYQNEILSTVGVSSASINSSNIDAQNPSMMVSAEREKLSVRTRNSLIQERKIQLHDMFIDLFGSTIPEINFANFGVNIEPNMLNSLNTMINNNNISKETALKLLFPH